MMCTRSREEQGTMKPRYSALAFIIISPIEYVDFNLKKCFYGYLYAGNKKNHDMKHNFN